MKSSEKWKAKTGLKLNWGGGLEHTTTHGTHEIDPHLDRPEHRTNTDLQIQTRNGRLVIIKIQIQTHRNLP